MNLKSRVEKLESVSSPDEECAGITIAIGASDSEIIGDQSKCSKCQKMPSGMCQTRVVIGGES